MWGAPSARDDAMIGRAGPTARPVAQIRPGRCSNRRAPDCRPGPARLAIGCVAPSPVFGTRTMAPSASETRYSASTPLRGDDMMTALPSGAQVSPEIRWLVARQPALDPGDEIQQEDVAAFVGLAKESDGPPDPAPRRGGSRPAARNLRRGWRIRSAAAPRSVARSRAARRWGPLAAGRAAKSSALPFFPPREPRQAEPRGVQHARRSAGRGDHANLPFAAQARGRSG